MMLVNTLSRLQKPRSLVPTTIAIVTILLAGCGGNAPQADPTTTTVHEASPSTIPSTSTTKPPTSATSSSTTRPPPDSPTLGLTGAWFEGSGFGQVEPTTIFLGGDPTGLLTAVTWSTWGGSEATGKGTGWFVPPSASTTQGSYQQASIVSFDLGRCGNHRAYEEVDWYFPLEGQKFDPSEAEYACTKAFVDSNTQRILYNPWSSPGHLLSGTKVQATISGTGCNEPSAFDVANPDAWRCSLPSGSFADPCFAPDHSSDVSQVACSDSPWSPVTLINLAKPMADTSWGTPTSNPSLPWAMQLANGDECGIIEGTGTTKAGHTFNFGCSYGYAAYPSTDRATWSAPYLPKGSSSATAIRVVTTWE
jgi:hypothetical protein